MKKLLTYLFLITSLASHAQPGTLRLDSLLWFVGIDQPTYPDIYYVPKSYHLDDIMPGGIYKVPFDLLAQLDSVHLYHVDNGKESTTPRRWVVVADTMTKEYYGFNDTTSFIKTYSKESGLVRATENEDGRHKRAYFYDEQGQMDSTVAFEMQRTEREQLGWMPKGKEVIEFDGKKETCKHLPSDRIKYIREFDSEGHITSALYGYSDGKMDSTTYTTVRYNWKNGHCIQRREVRLKNNEVTLDQATNMEWDERGLLRRTYNLFHDKEHLSWNVPVDQNKGVLFEYETGVNEKGQTTVTRISQDFFTTYTFDERGNWVSIAGNFMEYYRILFYKQK